MYPSRRFGYSDDPWFRIGTFPVSTTAFVVGLGVVSMIVTAAEGQYGPLYRNLVLLSEDLTFRGMPLGSVLEGEVWRLVTWPIPNEISFWTIILFAIFYMLGSQIESLLGRWRFAFFLVALTVIPAVVVTALEVLTGVSGGVAGLRMVEVGVLVAFAAQYAHARFWPGIPGWVIAIVIVGLDVLQYTSNRNWFALNRAGLHGGCGPVRHSSVRLQPPTSPGSPSCHWLRVPISHRPNLGIRDHVDGLDGETICGRFQPETNRSPPRWMPCLTRWPAKDWTA